MNMFGWVQLALFIVLLFLLTKPVGIYLTRVLDPEGKTFLDAALRPVERLFYRLFGLDPKKEQAWQEYALSLVSFSLIGCLFTYAILRLQHLLPLNPQGFGPVSARPGLQHGRQLHHQHQLAELRRGVHPVLSFADGGAGLPQLRLGRRGNRGRRGSGAGDRPAFGPDDRQLLGGSGSREPISAAADLHCLRRLSRFPGNDSEFPALRHGLLVEPTVVEVARKDAAGRELLDAQGKPVMEKQTVVSQTIAQGPVASQVAIKMLGTNGGGFMNANAAHPYENPTPLSNFLQMLSIFLIPSGLTYTLGRMVKNQASRLDGLGGHDRPFPGRGPRLLVGRGGRQPESASTWRGSGWREHGRQGSPLRDLQFRPVRHRHDRRLLRRGQRHARFLHPAGRSRPPLQYAAGRGHLRRRRARGSTACSSLSC